MLELTDDQRSEWIETYEGVKFTPLDPDPLDVRIGDIAHALSNKCRYTGHSEFFYCVHPDMRVLTSALEWVPAGQIQPGTRLIGFDENKNGTGTRASLRRLRPCVVEATARVVKECYRLTLSDGTELVSSAEHPWLVAHKAAGNQRWETTEEIARVVNEPPGQWGDRKRWLPRFLKTWVPAGGFGSGYFSGLLDGEGFVSIKDNSIQVAVSQNPGTIQSTIEMTMERWGFDWNTHAAGTKDVLSTHVRGGWSECVRLMGMFRPVRLIEKFKDAFDAGGYQAQFPARHGKVEVVKAEHIGPGECAALQTSTRTFFCEGFGSHNSVAEHSVLIAEYIERQWDDDHYAMIALLHDAAEAYLPDVSTPLKRAWPWWENVEARVRRAVFDALGVPGFHIPASVKYLDDRIKLTEARVLMTSKGEAWPRYRNMEPLDVRIHGWTPQWAKSQFLAAYARIANKVRNRKRPPVTA